MLAADEVPRCNALPNAGRLLLLLLASPLPPCQPAAELLHAPDGCCLALYCWRQSKTLRLPLLCCCCAAVCWLPPLSSSKLLLAAAAAAASAKPYLLLPPAPHQHSATADTKHTTAGQTGRKGARTCAVGTAAGHTGDT